MKPNSTNTEPVSKKRGPLTMAICDTISTEQIIFVKWFSWEEYESSRNHYFRYLCWSCSCSGHHPGIPSCHIIYIYMYHVCCSCLTRHTHFSSIAAGLYTYHYQFYGPYFYACPWVHHSQPMQALKTTIWMLIAETCLSNEREARKRNKRANR